MIHVIHYSAFLLLRAAELILTLLPRSIALRIGWYMGLGLYTVGLRKNIVRKNMLHVKLCPPGDLNSVIKKVYCTTSKYAVDFLRNGKLPPYRIHNFQSIEVALTQNKGLIAVLAHFGNWELLAHVFGSMLPSLHVIAKSMSNPYINVWLEKKRNSSHVETIYREQALRKMIHALSKNSTVAILIDQHGGKHGTEALFLDNPAGTVKTVAGMVYKMKCPVVSTYSILRDDNSYDIYLNDLLQPDTDGLSEDDAIRVHQNCHNQILSSWIKTHPEHYFGWFHKRFKGYLNYSER